MLQGHETEFRRYSSRKLIVRQSQFLHADQVGSQFFRRQGSLQEIPVGMQIRQQGQHSNVVRNQISCELVLKES